MEKFEGSQKSEKPEMDAIDKEAHEMFKENAINTLQEAFHIDEAIDLVEEQIKKGILNPNMTIEEMIDVLENRKTELIGDDDTDDDTIKDDDNSEESK